MTASKLRASPKKSRGPHVWAIESCRPWIRPIFSPCSTAMSARSWTEPPGAEPGTRKEEHDAGSVNGADLLLPSSEFRVPHLEAWLFTVTRNHALDHIRKHSRIIPMTLPDDRPCADPGPAETLERRETADSIFDLLDALSANQREVIRLKFQNDLSYREIADVTKLSVTNIGFLLHTGLKKLRALLREQPVPDFVLQLRSTP